MHYNWLVQLDPVQDPQQFSILNVHKLHHFLVRLQDLKNWLLTLTHLFLLFEATIEWSLSHPIGLLWFLSIIRHLKLILQVLEK